MSAYEFEFSLRVDAGPGAHALAESVAAEVFRHVGCADIGAVASALHAALDEICRPGGGCGLGFRAHGGTLDITVSAGGHSRHLQQPIP